jgi:hypothetical protein
LKECFHRAHQQCIADAEVCRTASIEDGLGADPGSANSDMDVVHRHEVH